MKFPSTAINRQHITAGRVRCCNQSASAFSALPHHKSSLAPPQFELSKAVGSVLAPLKISDGPALVPVFPTQAPHPSYPSISTLSLSTSIFAIVQSVLLPPPSTAQYQLRVLAPPRSSATLVKGRARSRDQLSLSSALNSIHPLR